MGVQYRFGRTRCAARQQRQQAPHRLGAHLEAWHLYRRQRWRRVRALGDIVDWPLIVVTSTDMMELSVGLASVQSAFGLQWAQIMASALLAALPIILVFAFFQRQIVQGFTASGVKG